ncbi:NAD(P)H-dependent oxidoreductase [Alkalimonas delamerensis]|uniref:FMN dependent NADH:quinone oxidoreductase n=1 Tax=Alkalimonas delamerensis TaxID=265981 RepID=A0ABT9GML9_9GAMM|nr:NAD(P)H-dependent oxidoreductase [Alkalimonas delamerensis]MDP4528196.1 NAD(P)H-dependent oxidoreductase [Alkalimonas delamerensis]
MKTVLVIESSISGKAGKSSQLVASFLATLPSGVQLDRLDLNAEPLPHLEMNEIAAWMTPEEERTLQQAALARHSDDLIARFKQADAIVLGVPMYNFGIPSQLKALLDRVARAGVTFKYTEQGPVGLLDAKPVVVFATRGGLYQGTAADSQTPFLQQFFNFIGLSEQHFIYAEGLNLGEEAATKALEKAEHRLAEVSRELVAA